MSVPLTAVPKIHDTNKLLDSYKQEEKELDYEGIINKLKEDNKEVIENIKLKIIEQLKKTNQLQFTFPWVMAELIYKEYKNEVLV